MLRRLWRYFRHSHSSSSTDEAEALRRAWIRDQLLEARIRLLEQEVLDHDEETE